ncbi:MAG: ATP-dependent RNA helicase DbpA [Pseudomonadales bacterium]|nr:ATP-dependent RNA helicase DbpA [Pseudomonadales bacterium]MDP4639854.1 ATP-dependent RNA helicase DbpA [Pseudomonadales bacterium]MDP4764753.1 ATP-dependent RNA helicase DbpA [Pseudomonadales bacterium]MDP4911353.1 ATP-dependent RNA helicase DbpA [Pseudomonadales bacterium]MDP5059782.1 ATP-dependent RNA helicase DbpA [Pseudomonadales bacterium]
MSPTAFSTLALPAEVLANLDSLGYTSMTPIQATSLPLILAGRDVIGQGKTGSGKTAAFGLGLLAKLDPSQFCVQCLVLCPTRELADQVTKEIRRLARATSNIKILTLCGGTPFGPQVGSLEHGVHVVVGTPGRIDDHLRKGTLQLAGVKTLVLDEADRMLDMGFEDVLDAIVKQVPADRQTLLFSATFTPQMQAVAQRLLRNPALVQVAATHNNETIAQYFYQVQEAERTTALRLLLLQYYPESTLVFCNTRHETQQVADELLRHGFSALALHGDLEQRERDQILVRFANKSVSVLVATDVAARGLDIEALDAVINYRIAQDAQIHVHRIGRTGRAGSRGIACTLYSSKELHKLAQVTDDVGADSLDQILPPLLLLDNPAMRPPMACLQIDGGRKQKVRPGDILGALTGAEGVDGDAVGKIHIFDQSAYVAVRRDVARTALQKIQAGKLKGRNFKARLVRDR